MGNIWSWHHCGQTTHRKNLFWNTIILQYYCLNSWWWPLARSGDGYRKEGAAGMAISPLMIMYSMMILLCARCSRRDCHWRLCSISGRHCSAMSQPGQTERHHHQIQVVQGATIKNSSRGAASWKVWRCPFSWGPHIRESETAQCDLNKWHNWESTEQVDVQLLCPAQRNKLDWFTIPKTSW